MAFKDHFSGHSAAYRQFRPTYPPDLYRYLATLAPLKSRSCDLITAAQSAHWFDFAAFYAEAARVGRPGAALALWSYGHCTIDSAVDACVTDFNRKLVGKYWPSFAPSVEWSAEDLVRHIGTWSAVSRYQDAVGSDPLPALRERFAVSWGDGTTRRVSWPLHLIVGRVANAA